MSLSDETQKCTYQFCGDGVFGQPDVQDGASEAQAAREEGVET
jgi:hypothetical protein